MIHVLFVDDDKLTQKIVKEILESSSYVVTTMSDPRDAMERMESESFDIIITDANMPGGISGFDFCRTLRAMDKFAKLPIAILTGRREPKDIQLGLEAGADDYILKPIDPLILLGKIESLLKKRPAGIPTTRFSERTVRQKAAWQLEIEILYISERGLVLSCPLITPDDAKIRINSNFFDQIGIAPPLLRVTSCSKDPANSNMYQIKTNFIGLGDSDLQKIRNWINTSNSAKKVS